MLYRVEQASGSHAGWPAYSHEADMCGDRTATTDQTFFIREILLRSIARTSPPPAFQRRIARACAGLRRFLGDAPMQLGLDPQREYPRIGFSGSTPRPCSIRDSHRSCRPMEPIVLQHHGCPRAFSTSTRRAPARAAAPTSNHARARPSRGHGPLADSARSVDRFRSSARA